MATQQQNTFLVIFCSGLEPFVETEIRQKINPTKLTVFQGAVIFETPLSVSKVIELRSVDIICSFVAQVNIPQDAKGKEKLREMAPELSDWENGYLLWRENRTRLNKLQSGSLQDAKSSEQTTSEKTSGISEADKSDKLANIPRGGDEIRFRCTAQRKGTHAYTSQDIAWNLGSSINDTFQWKPDMKGHNLEVFADVREELLLVGIVLSDHKKFMLQDYLEYGTTKLRTSVANALGRVSNIQPGDVVVDPCCGMGTIPIECSWIWKEAVYLGGDVEEDTAQKAKRNVDHTKTKVDIFHWSARKLPFKAQSIDKIISDLPFGRRSGTHKGNAKLYAWLFKEMTRVLKLNGTATLLTLERALVESLLKDFKHFQVIDLHTIDMDGLSPRLYVLKKIETKKT